MEIITSVGFMFTASMITTAQLEITVTDFAKFYAASWKTPQSPTKDKYHHYIAQLKLLSSALPPRFTKLIKKAEQNMGRTVDLVPWVLTHQHLSGMNINVDPSTGHITGVVDWADAAIEPFDMALWGLESVLGCGGPNGWLYFGSNPSQLRALFWEVLLKEIECTISEECRYAIDEVRTLGVLLRYGFSWEDGTVSPVKDAHYLDVFLKDELKMTEELYRSGRTV